MNIEYNLSEAEIEELKDIIKEFLSKYKYLYEIRIQKLIYYSELYSIENYGVRITNTEFKPYYHGSFSETIRETLENMDLPDQTVRSHGNRTRRYMNYGISSSNLSEQKKRVIKRIHQKTRKRSTDELAELSKESWLFQNTTEGDAMNFEDYKSYIADKFGYDPRSDQNWRQQLLDSDVSTDILTCFDKDAPRLQNAELVGDGGFLAVNLIEAED